MLVKKEIIMIDNEINPKLIELTKQAEKDLAPVFKKLEELQL